MFKPGDRVQMYRNNEKITCIPNRYVGFTGNITNEKSVDGKWVGVATEDDNVTQWYIPISYLKRIK